MRRFLLLVALAVSLGVAIGCGASRPAPPPGYPVTGNVTFNGQPLASGTITLDPDPPLGFPPATAKIVSGKFSTSAPAGKMKVRISSMTDSGKKDIGGIPLMVESLPPDANAKTKLHATISESSPNDLKFDIKG